MALSLNGNERLCGSCADGLTLVNADPSILGAAGFLLDANGDGKITRQEVENCFSDSEKECANKTPIFGFCKFSSAENAFKHVAWS